MANIQKVNNDEVMPVVNEKILDDYIFWLKNSLTTANKKLFLNIAKLNNLNPFKKEVYAIWYGDNMSIVTGYQVYIDRANKTWLLNGWSAKVIKEWDKILGAKIIIHRKDWEQPFEWEVSWDEYKKEYYDKYKKVTTLTPTWKQMPEFMIKKVAIGQGFRLCFPWDVACLPYLAEEITDKSEREVEEAVVIEEIVKLPTNKIQQVQIKWKEMADVMGWDFKDSDIKRKAKIKTLYWVDSTVYLTVVQADDFISKITAGIAKQPKVETVEEIAEVLGGEVVENKS